MRALKCLQITPHGLVVCFLKHKTTCGCIQLLIEADVHDMMLACWDLIRSYRLWLWRGLCLLACLCWVSVTAMDCHEKNISYHEFLQTLFIFGHLWIRGSLI